MSFVSTLIMLVLIANAGHTSIWLVTWDLWLNALQKCEPIFLSCLLDYAFFVCVNKLKNQPAPDYIMRVVCCSFRCRNAMQNQGLLLCISQSSLYNVLPLSRSSPCSNEQTMQLCKYQSNILTRSISTKRKKLTNNSIRNIFLCVEIY